MEEPALVPALVDDAEFLGVVAGELPRIQRIALLLTDDPDAAEDLVAEAIARSLPRYRQGTIDDPPAYLRRVVVNLAKRRWRRRAMSRHRDHHALDWMPLAPPADQHAVDRDRTLRAVMQLPVRRRAVVVLRFYDDLTEAEIARVLGISVGTVKSQLSRALEQLRGELATQEES
jgi:RNA polymerase sigma-70 factor (sigma-E family)